MRDWPAITPTGTAAVAAALGLGVLGWSLGYVVLTVVAAGISAAVVTGWFAALTVPRVDVERIVEPPRVERGRPAIGLVSVRNPSRYRSRGCTAIEQVGDTEVTVDVPPLAARRSIAVSYEIPTHRRGALSVGPLSISRRDPFGLWRSRRPVGAVTTVLVQPRIHRVDPRPAGRTRHIDGPVSDTAPRGTQTFHSLREYAPGDDVRRVHWRSSARTGTLMVREHVDTSLPSTVVVLDTRADRYDGDGFEEAVDVASSIVASSQARGFPVRLVTTTGQALLARAGQRGQDLRDFLTTVQPGEAGDYQHASTVVLRGRDHDVIAVVGGELAAGDLGQITAMCRRFSTPTLVTVRPPAETSRPRWTAGLHLDGTTATHALRRWQTSSVPGSTGVGT